MESITKVNSIEEIHEIFNLGKPKHPLITVINISDIEIPQEMVGVKVVTNLYCIALKETDGNIVYGRNSYDFETGTMIFTAPYQVIAATESLTKNEKEGWLLYFHPDFLGKSLLGKEISQYNFFGYQTNEALHLSQSEKKALNDIVDTIREECTQEIDAQWQNIVILKLELLLNYSLRFYERQFASRSVDNQYIVAEFEVILNTFINKKSLSKKGMPNLSYFAEEINVSSNYLSDLLRKETGYSAKEHINNLILRKSKILLLGSNNTVSEIAFSLGFNYPHYFTRFFKLKTGITPNNYRKIKNDSAVVYA